MNDHSLANEIYQVQVSKNLPGLADVCSSLIKSLNLPNICDKIVIRNISKLTWKQKVKAAITMYEEDNLRKVAKSKSKLRDGHIMTENFKCQDYIHISKMKISQSRTNFQMRSKMLDIKFNYSAKYEKDLWLCDSCCSAIETQSHILFCPAYASFREGKDLKSYDDLNAYVQNVMKVRTKLNLKK